MTLQVIGLRHRFGERVALDGVDLTVQPGVLTGLLGPNGAGKTTLMRVMLGVIEADAGEVLIDGRRVGFADRQRWGYMPQERGLYPSMPAGEQLVYMARVHGIGKDEAQDRARALLEELGLGDRWADRTDKLSGGMQQRLQIARNLVTHPRLVLMDEPTSGLDVSVQARLLDLVRGLVAELGLAVIIVTHDLAVARLLSHRIMVMRHGRVIESGLTDQVLDDPSEPYTQLLVSSVLAA